MRNCRSEYFALRNAKLFCFLLMEASLLRNTKGFIKHLCVYIFTRVFFFLILLLFTWIALFTKKIKTHFILHRLLEYKSNKKCNFEFFPNIIFYIFIINKYYAFIKFILYFTSEETLFHIWKTILIIKIISNQYLFHDSFIKCWL